MKGILHKNKNTDALPYLIAGILFMAVFIGTQLFIIHRQSRPVVETAKSEVRKLPVDIKKRLANITPAQNLHVPILMYHYVEHVTDMRDTIRQSLNVPPNIFEDQVKTLSEAGYTFMTARELGDVLDGKTPLPPKPILITIDDGHWDVDTDILPILKKYHAKATAYIISGFTGRSDFINSKQIQDVINSGLIEVGAHTVNHVSLKGKFRPIVSYEVKESKKMLEETYHISVVSFAYPNGSFDTQAADSVKDAGFETAVSTIPGTEVHAGNRYFLYRSRPGRRTGTAFMSWLTSLVSTPS